MTKTIVQKLRIGKNFILLALNPPANFKKSLGRLPAGVTITTAGKNYNQIHWFVMNHLQVEKQMNKVLSLIKEDIILWIYYPKGSSGLQTDLNRDKGWESLLVHGDELAWISLLSFDDTWSVFGCRQKTAADKKKQAQPKPEREVFRYVDAATRQIRLPDDLAAVLKKNKKEADLFHTLSFTNKKEYIEWVITAKREETRNERVKATVERLGKGWKNPANR